jgi:SAM-dependent methyltransferase
MVEFLQPTMDKKDPQDLYGEKYYATSCGLPYRRDEHWLTFFGSIADQIVKKLRPGSVLDAGCAFGFLVESLRDRGVEAYGLDISAYALENAADDVRPFCWQASVTDPLERDYDLIVCIEVLEHLLPDETKAAVQNFSRHAKQVLFSSTPYDVDEPTHVNVQQPFEWAALFYDHGFTHRVNFDAGFVTDWAMLFEHAEGTGSELVRAYEQHLWDLTNKLEELSVLQQKLSHQVRQQEALQEKAEKLEAQTNALLTQNDILQASLQGKEDLLKVNQRDIQDLLKQLQQKDAQVQEIFDSTSWKIASRLTKTAQFLKK